MRFALALTWLAIAAVPAMARGQAPDDAGATTAEFYAAQTDLRAYVLEALEHNPSVQALAARHRAAIERVPQVRALPDPVLGFSQAVRSVETRVGPQWQTLSLSQAFPWFGTLDLRGQVALREAAATYQLYLARQRDVIAKVKAAFYDLSYVDAATAISEEERLVLEHYEQLAQARYATGQGLQQAVIKTQAEITKVIDRLQVLNQQRQSLAARLNTLMARPPEQPLAPIGHLEIPDVDLDLDELYDLGNRNRQELQAARELIERGERAIDLAEKKFRPDFTVSAGFVNVAGRGDLAAGQAPPPDNGKNALSLSVGLTIPLRREKYRAGVREAAESLVAERQNLESLQDEMEFSIRDQVVRLQTLREQVTLFEQVLLAQTEESLRSAEAAYETGQLGTLDLLDAERTLLEVRVAHERHYADYLVALANLERAVGTKFPTTED